MASDAGKYKFIARQSDISGAQAMVVNPDVIATPSDLNGKRIGYVSGNSSEALWLRVVEEYDLTPPPWRSTDGRNGTGHRI